MKQKKYTILIITVLFAWMINSCKKEDANIDITANTWEVVKIKKQGETSYTKTKESYILEFTSDTTYALSLDVNSCGGYYEILNSGKIDISEMACTEICCDSEFAKGLSLLFPKMTKYYGKGKELIFEGQGEVILEQQ